MTRFRSRASSALIFALAMTPFAGAQETPPSTEEELRQERVVVEAPKISENRAFVKLLTETPRGAEQLGRWDGSVCVFVAGPPAGIADAISERIASRAREVGLAVEGEGCRPNVAVYLTDAPARLARGLYERDRNLFDPPSNGPFSTLGDEKLEAFLDGDQPARWWHIVGFNSFDGTPVSFDSFGVATVRATGSRLRSAIRQDFTRVIIILDVNAAMGLSANTIGDYVAMLALTQVDPDIVRTNLPSIATLFTRRTDGSPAPSEMTETDLAYLEGLYSVPRNPLSTSQHEREIARAMTRETPDS